MSGRGVLHHDKCCASDDRLSAELDRHYASSARECGRRNKVRGGARRRDTPGMVRGKVHQARERGRQFIVVEKANYLLMNSSRSNWRLSPMTAKWKFLRYFLLTRLTSSGLTLFTSSIQVWSRRQPPPSNSYSASLITCASLDSSLV